MNAPGLCLQNISHRFGKVEAVRDVTLTIAPGEIHCLLGASGSGKSTLLRVIAGLERQQHGSASVAGEVMADSSSRLPAEKRPIGFVFQDYALFPHLSVLDNVLFGMVRRRSGESRRRAKHLLGDVGLAERLNSLPHMLSGGEQQRVALARAMARTPKVMLLDEPFSGLDSQLRADVRETTLRVLRAASVATIMVTHDPSEAVSCADRISVMHAGRMMQTDTPYQIYHYPAEERTAAIFGLCNRIPVVRRDGKLMTPFGEWQTAENTDLDSQSVFIRPERLSLAPPTPEAPAWEIGRVIREGATTLYEVRAPDTSTVHVRTLSTQHAMPGEKVCVRL